jgi:hypothetical protein
VSAATTATAAPTTATGADGCGRTGPTGHRDGGEQLHGVVVPCRTTRGRRRLAHRPGQFELVGALAALVRVGRHEPIVAPSGGPRTGSVTVESCRVTTDPTAPGRASATPPSARSAAASAGATRSRTATASGWSARFRAHRRPRCTAVPAATTRSSQASHTSWRGRRPSTVPSPTAGTGTQAAGPPVAAAVPPPAAGDHARVTGRWPRLSAPRGAMRAAPRPPRPGPPSGAGGRRGERPPVRRRAVGSPGTRRPAPG